MNEQFSVPTEAVLAQVTLQRDKALTDLAVAQAACQQLAERLRALEDASDTRKAHHATA